MYNVNSLNAILPGLHTWVKESDNEAYVHRFEHHNWWIFLLFLVKTKQYGLPLAQTQNQIGKPWSRYILQVITGVTRLFGTS